MISASDFVHLPYTPDLTEGGVAYAVRSLPYIYHRKSDSQYDRLRRTVARAAVELAFRRYLSEQNIPFDVRGAMPFTDPNQYDVSLGGRRCDIKSFLISYREQIAEMKRNPQVILQAPALVPSDSNAAEGHSDSDIYLFAFFAGPVAASQADLKKAIATGQPCYLIHAMPDVWTRPLQWNPLGELILKSDSAEIQIVEIGGQAEGREMRALVLEVPPRTRVKVEAGFYSLSHLHVRSPLNARMGIHSPALRKTHVIGVADWGNIWVYGLDILLAGYLTRAEFNRRASSVLPGARVFQYTKTRTKNLAVTVAELHPIADLLARIGTWSK